MTHGETCKTEISLPVSRCSLLKLLFRIFAGGLHDLNRYLDASTGHR